MEPNYSPTVGQFLLLTITIGAIIGVSTGVLWFYGVPHEFDWLDALPNIACVFTMIWSCRKLQWHTRRPFDAWYYITTPFIPILFWCMEIAAERFAVLDATRLHAIASISAGFALFLISDAIVATNSWLRYVPERAGVWDLSNRV